MDIHSIIHNSFKKKMERPQMSTDSWVNKVYSHTRHFLAMRNEAATCNNTDGLESCSATEANPSTSARRPGRAGLGRAEWWAEAELGAGE